MWLSLLTLTALSTPLPAAAPQDDDKPIFDLVLESDKATQVLRKYGYVDGPAWSPDGFLIFSDTRNNKLIQFEPNLGEDFVLVEPAGMPTGVDIDIEGNMYVCQKALRRIVQIAPNGVTRVLTKEIDGKRFNSPDDLTLDEYGGLYFTDPRYGQHIDRELKTMDVYYWHPDTGVKRVIGDELGRPNGIVLSPDGKTLYVADPDRLSLFAYPVTGPGELGRGKKIFTGVREQFGAIADGSGPDGLTVDERGNVYMCFKDVVVITPEGETIGRIHLNEWPSNACFGGDQGNELWITARNGIYKVPMKVGGAPKRLPILVVDDEPAPEDPVEEDGWQTLFDGETLNGWTTTGGRYDGQAVWTVEDGAITGREGPNGEGGLLYTEGKYGDFEFECETMVDFPFDSGIFLRMVPDERGAQVTIDFRDKGEVGGIYSDGWLYHNFDGRPRMTANEWSKFRVRCLGDPMDISVWLNDQPLTYYSTLPGLGEFAREGLIGLQVHGATGAPSGHRARFRDVRVKPIEDYDGDEWPEIVFEDASNGRKKLSVFGHRAGWITLLDGSDLEAWEPVGGTTGFGLNRDGELELKAAGDAQYLRTKADFQNFHLRMEFKIARMANSGVFLRSSRDDSNPSFSGAEVQILDDFNWEEVTGTRLKNYQFTGGLYGSLAPGTLDALKPLGEWNTYDIVYYDSKIRVKLNGVTLYDVDTGELPGEPAFADRAARGFIGLQRHAPDQVEGDTYAWFRNVFVRRL